VHSGHWGLSQHTALGRKDKVAGGRAKASGCTCHDAQVDMYIKQQLASKTQESTLPT
jgi:hypothetical protein